MNLALFDLDNTLLADDSDYLWGHFLMDEGLVERADYESGNDYFYRQYQAGTLDIHAYQRFALAPLTTLSPADIDALQRKFLATRVEKIVAPAARGLLKAHRDRGDELVIITATNRIVTAPIAAHLGVDHLLATEPAFENDRVTGEIEGVPCFQDGKIERLRQWLDERPAQYARSWFYSDSRNDLPLLEYADVAVAIDPDPVLEQAARERGWPVLSLRHQPAEEVFGRVAGR